MPGKSVLKITMLMAVLTCPACQLSAKSQPVPCGKMALAECSCGATFGVLVKDYKTDQPYIEYQYPLEQTEPQEADSDEAAACK